MIADRAEHAVTVRMDVMSLPVKQAISGLIWALDEVASAFAMIRADVSERLYSGSRKVRVPAPRLGLPLLDRLDPTATDALAVGPSGVVGKRSPAVPGDPTA